MRNAVRSAVGGYVRSAPDMVATGKIWPNGEFSLGYTRVGQAGHPDEEWLWTGGDDGLTQEQLDARLAVLHSYLEAHDSFDSVNARMAFVHLTLSNALNSHKPILRTKNGLKGLTAMGGKMLRSGCYLLEESLGRKDVVMITMTVPTLPHDERRVLAERWGAVTNRLVQWISRELAKAGRPQAVAGCVEVQTRRLESSGQGYLHLHLVCPAYSNAPGRTWAIDAGRLRTWWCQELERVTNYTLPHLPRVETAIVEKSVEGYLGKYISKGGDECLEKFISDLGVDAVPGQWWFMSSVMRAAVKSGTVQGRNAGAVLDAVVNHLLEQGTGEGFEYVRHVDCEMSGLRKTVGFVGRLTKEFRAELASLLRA